MVTFYFQQGFNDKYRTWHLFEIFIILMGLCGSRPSLWPWFPTGWLTKVKPICGIAQKNRIWNDVIIPQSLLAAFSVKCFNSITTWLVSKANPIQYVNSLIGETKCLQACTTL